MFCCFRGLVDVCGVNVFRWLCVVRVLMCCFFGVLFCGVCVLCVFCWLLVDRVLFDVQLLLLSLCCCFGCLVVGVVLLLFFLLIRLFGVVC